jgi:hypothetical protein
VVVIARIALLIALLLAFVRRRRRRPGSEAEGANPDPSI